MGLIADQHIDFCILDVNETVKIPKLKRGRGPSAFLRFSVKL